MQAQATTDSGKPLVIVVPRTQAHLYTSLHRAFDHDSTVEVTVDRRLGARSDSGNGLRQRAVDRRRPDSHPELAAGRWIVVARGARLGEVPDANARAILFLCCSSHVVPCQQCQNTYRIGWLRRQEASRFACPLCENDLTATVLAHAQRCPNFG